MGLKLNTIEILILLLVASNIANAQFYDVTKNGANGQVDISQVCLKYMCHDYYYFFVFFGFFFQFILKYYGLITAYAKIVAYLFYVRLGFVENMGTSMRIED